MRVPLVPLLPVFEPVSAPGLRRIDAPRHITRHLPARWFWHWFRAEAMVLAFVNAAASLTVLALTITMLPLDMSDPASRNFLQITAIPGPRLAASLGAILCGFALFNAAYSYFFHRMRPFRRLFGFVVAAGSLVAGVWLIAAAINAGAIPLIFQPATKLAGGKFVADLDYVSAAVVPRILPALAMVAAAILGTKQARTSLLAGRRRKLRKMFAVSGIVASVFALVFGAYAAEMKNPADTINYAIAAGRASFAPAGEAYASPFAAGVPCHITDSYGIRRNPFDLAALEFHPGVDMAVAEGTPVHAMTSGRVVFAGGDGGFGNMVAIRPDDGGDNPATLLSGHMKRVLVSGGQAIRRGDVIGLVGSTGRSTGPHVHVQLCSSGHHNRFGGFVCGAAENPYESWRVLSAIARASCAQGPTVWRVSDALSP